MAQPSVQTGKQKAKSELVKILAVGKFVYPLPQAGNTCKSLNNNFIVARVWTAMKRPACSKCFLLAAGQQNAVFLKVFKVKADLFHVPEDFLKIYLGECLARNQMMALIVRLVIGSIWPVDLGKSNHLHTP